MNDCNTAGNPLVLATYNYSKGKFIVDGKRILEDNINYVWGYWIAICH